MRIQINNKKPVGMLSALKTIRACIYSRVSSEEQVRKEFSIPQIQIPEAIKLIKESGWIFTKTYVDEGKDCNMFLKRTALQQMLAEDIDDYDVVVVYSFDRLVGDDENTRGRIYSILDKSGKQITSIKQRVDIVPPEEYDPKSLNVSQRREVSNLGVSFDRKIRRERFMDSRNKTVEGGKHIVEPCYGYKIKWRVIEKDRERPRTIGYRIINEGEAPILKRIFTERANGKPVRQTVLDLNKEGIKTRKGSTWSTARLYQVLRNPLPAGHIIWNRTRHRKFGDDQILTPLPKEKWQYIPVNKEKEKYYKPIISEELFDRVQEISKQNKKLHPKAIGSTNILGGLIKCPVCGKSMVETSFYRVKKYPYRKGTFQCADYINKGSCSKQRFSSWKIKEAIIKETEKYLLCPEKFNKYQTEIKKKKVGEKRKELTVYERKLKKTQTRLYSLNMKYIDGKIKEPYYKELLTGLEKEENTFYNTVIGLKEEIKDFLKRKEEINQLKNFAKILHQKLRDLDIHKQKHILRSLIQEITFDKKPQKWQIFFRV